MLLLAVLVLAQADIQQDRRTKRDAALVAWRDCTSDQARRLAAANAEPAATIADAALGVCAPQQREFTFWTSELVKTLNDSAAFAARVTGERRDELRGLAIASVIDRRSARRKR